MKSFNSNILNVTRFIVVFFGIITMMSCSKMESLEIRDNTKYSKDLKLTNTKENDAEFLSSSAEIYIEEIELGQLAQKNSAMPDVIKLGKMMEVEHTKALKELQMLAAKKQINILSNHRNNGKNSYNKLKDKFGIDFDQEYCRIIVEAHKNVINKFENASAETKDADIQTWVETMLITLKSHLDDSMICQEKCEQLQANA